MLEIAIALGAFTLLGALPPTERQKERARHAPTAGPLRQQIAALQRVGVMRRR